MSNGEVVWKLLALTKEGNTMKLTKITCSVLAALSVLAASACEIQVRVACPNDVSVAGIEVCVAGYGCATTDEFGIATLPIPDYGTYSISVTASTLPPGAVLKQQTMKVKVDTIATPIYEFVLSGDFCDCEPPSGYCWLTGGGTIGKTKGVADYSFGGVVYPGCSPKAADGGNLNVVDHATSLHFQGRSIIVDSCSGVATRSPRVNVNVIDFHGTGTIVGVAGNPTAKAEVTFEGRAIDNMESGGGSDMLYLKVMDANGVVMQIGDSADGPVTISTGNLQIHTTSCD